MTALDGETPGGASRWSASQRAAEPEPGRAGGGGAEHGEPSRVGRACCPPAILLVGFGALAVTNWSALRSATDSGQALLVVARDRGRVGRTRDPPPTLRGESLGAQRCAQRIRARSRRGARRALLPRREGGRAVPGRRLGPVRTTERRRPPPRPAEPVPAPPVANRFGSRQDRSRDSATPRVARPCSTANPTARSSSDSRASTSSRVPTTSCTSSRVRGRAGPRRRNQPRALCGNQGTQFYAVPAGVDPTAWTVLVWCRTFAVPVAHATPA